MTYIPQRQLENIRKLVTPAKVVVIYGARRVGKTTLLKKFLEGEDIADILFVNGDDIVVRQYLESQGTTGYFWRTYDRKEIDLVEEHRGKLSGYEIKWKDIPVKVPRDWQANYPEAGFKVIHRENYLDFIQ